MASSMTESWMVSHRYRVQWPCYPWFELGCFRAVYWSSGTIKWIRWCWRGLGVWSYPFPQIWTVNTYVPLAWVPTAYLSVPWAPIQKLQFPQVSRDWIDLKIVLLIKNIIVTDSLFSQAAIASNLVSISFQPTNSLDIVNGELTFGGMDSTQFVGSINFA